MTQLSEPLAEITQSYCHVEWFELTELAEEILHRRRPFDIDALRKQMAQIIEADQIPYRAINDITGNKFNTEEETRQWLRGVFELAFPQQAKIRTIGHRPNFPRHSKLVCNKDRQQASNQKSKIKEQ